MTIGTFIEQLKELVPDMNQEIALFCIGNGADIADSISVHSVSYQGKITEVILLGNQAFIQEQVGDEFEMVEV